LSAGLDPKVCRLFIIDGAKALSKVIRRTFGAPTPIQRCQIHKARNVIERLPKPLHASVRRALRQAWELDDADKAERLLRNLARRLDQEAPGVAASIRARRDADRQPPRLACKAQALASPAPTQLRT
jgi:putative transposase